jgi:hypothetical protein
MGRLITALATVFVAAAALLAPQTAGAAPLKVEGATFFSSVSGAMTGSSVAKAGDVNGDGVTDVVIGAPRSSTATPAPARKENGAAYVVFGPFGPHEVVNLDNLGARGFKVIGGADLEPDKMHFGSAVAGVGDVNGDGRDDVAVTSERGGKLNTNAYKGFAAVVFGRTSTTTIDLRTGIGASGFLVNLPNPYYAHTLLSVAGVGDVNGDGLPDLAIGDPVYYDKDSSYCTDCARGDVYVVFGRGATTPLEADALGPAGYRIQGHSTRSYLGVGLSGAGDINHDGHADLVLGEPQCIANTLPCDGGLVYVLYGKSDTGAVDLSQPLDSTHGFRITGPVGPNGLGTAVAAPGDVNGDGRGDLLLGAPYTSGNTRTGNGAAYVVFLPEHPPASIDLGAIGISAALIQGAADGDALGSSLAAAGDVDGDGYADVAVGAPHHGSGKRGSGYVLRNLHQPMVADAATLAPPDGYELIAARPESLALSLANLGDLDGDGRDDLLLGGPTGDPPFIADGGFAELQFDSPFPSAITGAAKSITPSTVTVGAGAMPAGQPTSVRVQYGPGASLGNESAPADAGDGTARVTLDLALGGLSPSTAYSYRVLATNGSGTVYGRSRTFTTAAPDGTGGGGDGGGDGGPGPGVDVTAPVARVTSPARRKRARRSAWRTLRGTVTDAKPSAGIKWVQVAATVRSGRQCRSLGRKGFAAAACSARTRWVTATVKGRRWQLRLKGLVRGAARFRVRARDNAGNLQKPAFALKIRLKG